MKRLISIITAGMLIVGQFPCVGLAKITPRDKENYKMIIIKKGDTLGELAKEYLGDANKWPEFKKYNLFDNPNMIYVGEKLAIGYGQAKEMAEDLEKVLEELRAEMKALEKELTTQRVMLTEKESTTEAERKALEKELALQRTTILEELTAKESITEAERKALEKELALQKTTLEGLDSTTEAGRKAIKDALAKKETDIATVNAKVKMLEKAIEELSVGLKGIEMASPAELARLKEEVKALREQDNLIIQGVVTLDERLTGAEAEIEKLKPKKKTVLSNLFILTGFSAIAYFLTTTE